MRPPNPFAYLPSIGSTPLGTRQTLPSQPPIRDTQCGFKLFTRPSAQVIFPLSHIDRWIFDVELLLLAELASTRTMTSKGTSMEWSKKEARGKGNALLHLPLPISEVAVDWREVEGSKIDLLRDSIGMALDLIVIRLNYALGRWKSPPAVATGGESCAAKH
jgi:dolichyl-phosphate beta-glucosyltransferase